MFGLLLTIVNYQLSFIIKNNQPEYHKYKEKTEGQ